MKFRTRRGTLVCGLGLVVLSTSACYNDVCSLDLVISGNVEEDAKWRAPAATCAASPLTANFTFEGDTFLVTVQAPWPTGESQAVVLYNSAYTGFCTVNVKSFETVPWTGRSGDHYVIEGFLICEEPLQSLTVIGEEAVVEDALFIIDADGFED